LFFLVASAARAPRARLLLGRLEVASQVHGDLVLVAQQGLEHLVGRHLDPPERRALELAAELEDFLVEVVDLFVVLGDLGLHVEAGVVDLVDLGVDLAQVLLQLLVVHAVEVGKWLDPLGQDLLLPGGLPLGLLLELFLGFLQQQRLQLHFTLHGHLLVRHARTAGGGPWASLSRSEKRSSGYGVADLG